MQDVLDKLDSLGINYTLDEHEAAFTIEDVIKFGINERGMLPVNLFLRNANGKKHYLVIHDGAKHTDIKKLQEQINATHLSFASEERLMKHLGLTKGSVSPFGLINNVKHDVEVVLDESIVDQPLLGFHPNINTATVWLSYEDFMKFLNDAGNKITFVNC